MKILGQGFQKNNNFARNIMRQQRESDVANLSAMPLEEESGDITHQLAEEGMQQALIENSPTPVGLETESVANDVNRQLMGIGASGAMVSERSSQSRTPASPVGMGLGAKFERQYWNPFFQIAFRLFSKNAILRDVKEAQKYFFSALENTQLPSSKLEKVLLKKTGTSTMKAISTGGKIAAIEKGSISSLELLAPTLLGTFDLVLKDVEEGRRFGQAALKNQETIRKLRDQGIPIPGLFTPWRTKRHKNMSDSLVQQIKKARGEVEKNIDLARFELKRKVENTNAGIGAFLERVQNNNDNEKKAGFWKFVKYLTFCPEEFLSNPRAEYFGIKWKEEFKVDNPIHLLDAIKISFSGKAIEINQLSHQLTINQEAVLNNIDERESVSAKNLPLANFESLYTTLINTNLENAKEQVSAEEFSRSVRRGLVKCGVSINSIFKGAVVHLSPMEQVIYLVRYLNENPDILQKKEFPLLVKQKILRWTFDHLSEVEARFGADNAVDEQTTLYLRRYVLSNAQVVKDSSVRALESLRNIGTSVRNIDNPVKFQNDVARIKSFMTVYDSFFGESGQFVEKGMLEKLPAQEKEAVRSIFQLERFRNLLGKNNKEGGGKTGIFALEQEREKFDEEIISKLPPGNTEKKRQAAVEELKIAMRESRRAQRKAMGTERAGTWNADSFSANEKIVERDYNRLNQWQDAMRKQESFNFQIFLEATDFEKIIKQTGSGIQPALDRIPEPERNLKIDRNNLLNQRFQTKIQEDREDQFGKTLSQTLEQQWKTFFAKNREGNVVPSSITGINLSRLVVTDVTQTEGELDFPMALTARETLKNLEVVLQQENGTLILQDKEGTKGFEMKPVKVNGQFRLHVSVWERTPDQQGRNVIFRVPQGVQKKTFSVLNLFEGDEWQEQSGRIAPRFENGKEQRINVN